MKLVKSSFQRLVVKYNKVQYSSTNLEAEQTGNRKCPGSLSGIPVSAQPLNKLSMYEESIVIHSTQ